MTNRSRDKGTKAETAVVEWFHSVGENQVERHALHGSRDVGDLNGLPSLVVSVKMRGRDQPLDFSGWLRSVSRMQVNATRSPGEPLPSGLLIVRRVGYPDVGDWYAVQRLADWWGTFSELLT
jgi:hypothetical protein